MRVNEHSVREVDSEFPHALLYVVNLLARLECDDLPIDSLQSAIPVQAAIRGPRVDIVVPRGRGLGLSTARHLIGRGDGRRERDERGPRRGRWRRSNASGRGGAWGRVEWHPDSREREQLLYELH